MPSRCRAWRACLLPYLPAGFVASLLAGTPSRWLLPDCCGAAVLVYWRACLLAGYVYSGGMLIRDYGTDFDVLDGRTGKSKNLSNRWNMLLGFTSRYNN